jgi:predicted nucleotidyltransferase
MTKKSTAKSFLDFLLYGHMFSTVRANNTEGNETEKGLERSKGLYTLLTVACRETKDLMKTTKDKILQEIG